LETATLQKGLILAYDGKELVEEGMGFGVPVAIYRDEPYFSSTAKCRMYENGGRKTLEKSFVMDTVSRKRIGEEAYFNGGLYSIFHRIFHVVYTLNLPLTSVFERFIASASVVGLYTEFVRVKPRGFVTLRYTLQGDSVWLEASFDRLEKCGLEQAVLLNEQGADFFETYFDSNGQSLESSEIGAWQPVRAIEASLHDSKEKIGFTLRSQPNAILLRGREAIRGRYSWVGLSYSIRSLNKTFKYTVRLRSGRLA
jgi:hypothetical protein